MEQRGGRAAEQRQEQRYSGAVVQRSSRTVREAVREQPAGDADAGTGAGGALAMQACCSAACADVQRHVVDVCVTPEPRRLGEGSANAPAVVVACTVASPGAVWCS